MKNIILPLILFVAISIHAGHHEETKVAAQGMISSEVFNLAGGMDLHVEKYESCGAATGARHYHPYGILVYVLEGETVSNASGSNKPITAGNYWFERPNWEHGGIDDNENPEEAVWREMMEEIGTNNADLFKISNQWVKYNIPQETLDKLPWGKIFVGQKQKWFIFKFSGQENDINVETENPEFSEWKWMGSNDLIDNAVPFKRIVYKTILDEFSDIFNH